MKLSPPKRSLAFLRWFCREDYLEEIEGDLMELFELQSKTDQKKANRRFTWSVIRHFRPEFIKPIRRFHNPLSYGMFRNFLKIGWRNLLRNKGYTSINIGGLAVGIAAFITIILFVENEFSYDQWHPHANDIVRVVKDFVNEDGSRIPDATTTPAMAAAIRRELPEAAAVTRFAPGWGRKYLIDYEGKKFNETALLRVDSNFFKVFDFPFAEGSQSSPFQGVHSILLTESAAKKYFGNESPVNKTVRINLNNGTDYIVSGVLKDVPENSHFHFQFLIPFESRRDPDTDWNFYNFYTYVRLKPNTDIARFESNVQAIFKKHQPNNTNQHYVQPLTDIHLRSKLKWELGVNGDLSYVWILLTIAVFVLLVASINYINLVTAQSTKRAKEIGVRKVSGALRHFLVKQFLIESLLTVFISVCFSLVLIWISLPFIRSIFNVDPAGLLVKSKYFWIILPSVILSVGFLAGFYPAFHLSSIEVLKVLKGSYKNSINGVRLRQGLVVFQVAVSVILIISLIVTKQQLDFMREKNLGFQKENLLMLPNLRGSGNPAPTLRTSMLDVISRIPGVTGIARADGVLGAEHSVNGVRARNSDNRIALNFFRIDAGYLPIFQMKLLEGRNFFNRSEQDTSGIIINETAARQLGLKKPYAGQQLLWEDAEEKTHLVDIVGVVEDFHFTSFHETIKPFGFIHEENNGSTFFIKMQTQHLSALIKDIENIWKKHQHNVPFEYVFQDEQFTKLYQAENRLQRLVSFFTVLATVIACLGLFTLSAYTTASKTKEIGIRKVLGSTVTNILVLVSREFVILVIVAFLIAAPLAFIGAVQWLNGFAYRIDISWKVFALGGLAAVVILICTTGFNVIRAARMNPVKSLRRE